MSWKFAAVFASVAVGAGAAAVAIGDASTHEVGGHRFAVPKERLVEDNIPWLPLPEANTFSFRLEMDGPVDRQHNVLVEPAKSACRSNRMSQIVRVACGVETTRLKPSPPYRKVFPHADYPYAWNYYTVGSDRSGEGQEKLQVAYCSPIEPNPARPKGTAICNSVWGVDGLVLSLGFEEDELAELPSMRARATEMLLSWKVR